MDGATNEFIRAIGALNSRLTTHMTLIQKLQRTSNYDPQIEDLQQQIDELKLVVHKLCGPDIGESSDA
jgi:phage host-nuclease inhibitor protein Gam